MEQAAADGWKPWEPICTACFSYRVFFEFYHIVFDIIHFGERKYSGKDRLFWLRRIFQEGRMAKRAVKDSVRTRSFYIKRHYPAKKREQGRTGFSIERKE
ncbi:MAG TPA: hypothetical protein H9934_09880, partial [Candidatus Anaerobutyricum faecale]|nr:hypothetical protein [Candidatus Anaerobutyricum faecale]